ncbi:hypothetical protein E2562_010489, partial [Oryza meyeriana var. granulata]
MTSGGHRQVGRREAVHLPRWLSPTAIGAATASANDTNRGKKEQRSSPWRGNGEKTTAMTTASTR